MARGVGPATIRIEGARQLRRAIKDIAEATDDLKDTHLEAAKVVEGKAASSARFTDPSGSLMSTLRSSGTKTRGVVRLGTKRFPYAGVIHFGTPKTSGRPANIKPNPFIYEALDERRTEVLDVYVKRLDAIVRKHIQTQTP